MPALVKVDVDPETGRGGVYVGYVLVPAEDVVFEPDGSVSLRFDAQYVEFSRPPALPPGLACAALKTRLSRPR